ncbi:MAG: CpsD/CapB family tyrosine-protein kinase [Acidobacteriota bacterium]|jgi:capsular exopolysaccharide synthesis family protein|nr:CpsD/CapB family tyrosine-protein kinase [Acidobacteriota bacterium]
MSEIFDFLKKTEAVRKKAGYSSSVAAPASSRYAPPAAESQVPPPLGMPLGMPPPSDDFNGSLSTDDGFVPAEMFDFSQATDQMQNAMNPRTVLGEQFRVLRTKLSLLQKQNGIRTVLVTSTIPQEGKSFTSCALAGVMAQEQGKRVVIIDADMRKMGSGRDYGLNGNSGIAGTAQVLQGVSDFRRSLLKSIDPEFWFLPSGTLPYNPSELLSSPELEKMLRFAARNFDWVIVDAPPALSLSDPSLIAPLCDAVVFVVRVNSTPAKLVQETINKVGRERICGVVLNRQKQVHTSRYYYQYYYQKQK